MLELITSSIKLRISKNVTSVIALPYVRIPMRRLESAKGVAQNIDKVDMKRLIAVIFLALALAIPASASAFSSGQANSAGNSIARSDCGRASDWYCYDYPIGNNVYSCAANRWCVEWWYREAPIDWPFRSMRTCITYTHWAISNGALTYNVKSC